MGVSEIGIAVERAKRVALRSIAQAQTTETALARAVGISQPHLSNVLAGRRGLSISTAQRLEKVLEPLFDSPVKRAA